MTFKPSTFSPASMRSVFKVCLSGSADQRSQQDVLTGLGHLLVFETLGIVDDEDGKRCASFSMAKRSLWGVSLESVKTLVLQDLHPAFKLKPIMVKIAPLSDQARGNILRLIGLPGVNAPLEAIARCLVENREVITSRLAEFILRAADESIGELCTRYSPQRYRDTKPGEVSFGPYAQHNTAGLPPIQAESLRINWLGEHDKVETVTPQIADELRASIKAEQLALKEERAKVAALTTQLSEAREAARANPRAPSGATETESDFLSAADVQRSLRSRVRWLEHQIDSHAETAGAPRGNPAVPETWDELERFADEQLGGRVLLTRRAIKAARDSVFIDIPLAYKTLLSLANDYLPMRAGEDGARERFEARCRELKITVGPTGEALNNHRYRDAYSVKHMGRTYDLDQHVQGSSARDPKFCFRLYFALIENDSEPYILVGHLPGHLDNFQG